MAMTISPNVAEDPPPSSKISNCQKAFADGTPSLESTKLSVKQNNHLHRFEMSSDTGFNLGRRARSVSREHHGRNPVTHEGCWEKEALPARREASEIQPEPQHRPAHEPRADEPGLRRRARPAPAGGREVRRPLQPHAGDGRGRDVRRCGRSPARTTA
ncbi:unnamed protein product [Prorocentrum cordatum]|uniref:Uncharacterized protein n=1 Tax=Prorocentrum cordatum TaxID=2364126 RepID=A0ABN9VGI2_9DINO|nr:unnamed protein product [Polarella glacialis]